MKKQEIPSRRCGLRRVLAAVFLSAAAVYSSTPESLAGIDGKMHQPFSSSSPARVFFFVRTDCPITNRYAPELQRLSREFSTRGVQFWLVYPDPATTEQAIKEQLAQYSLPGTPLRDPQHRLTKLAKAKIAPEAAVFDSAGRLQYHGRIDDRWLNPGVSRQIARSHDLEDAISSVLAGHAPAQAETRAVGCWLADVE